MEKVKQEAIAKVLNSKEGDEYISKANKSFKEYERLSILIFISFFLANNNTSSKSGIFVPEKSSENHFTLPQRPAAE